MGDFEKTFDAINKPMNDAMNATVKPVVSVPVAEVKPEVKK